MTTFIGPDGQAINYQHNMDTCECSECDNARWQKIEREQYARYLALASFKAREDQEAEEFYNLMAESQ